MGEVYRARDTKLNRDVAIKVLPDSFAPIPIALRASSARRRCSPSLNHPHIAQIYGFEERGGTRALVMELVDGDTLARPHRARADSRSTRRCRSPGRSRRPSKRRTNRGSSIAISSPRISRCDADGTVKVLDFGLAKALEPVAVTGGDATASPTITSPAMTQMGMILGTAAYMSPEQAKGRQADKRSDVWAFGAVLYEMLSGQRAFKGDDVSDTLAAVLRQDVDWTALPASTPASVRRLIARCLDRDVKRRLRDIGEARIVLDDPAALAAGDARAAAALAPGPRGSCGDARFQSCSPRSWLVALAGTAAWYLKPSPPLAVTRFQFTLPEGQSFTGLARRMVDMSPDGTQIVYVANGRLYLRSMSERDAKAIQGTEGYEAVTNPVFSPDGRSVAFYATSDQTLKRIAVTGGAAVTICPADMPFGMSWGPDGIVFSEGSKGVMRVSPDGGTPDVLVSLKDGEVRRAHRCCPADGTSLHAGHRHRPESMGHRAHRRAVGGDGGTKDHPPGRRRRTLRPDGSPRVRRQRQLFAVPFDAQRLEVTGSPVPVVAGVTRASARGRSKLHRFRNGTLVYVPGSTSASPGQVEIALTDRREELNR